VVQNLVGKLRKRDNVETLAADIREAKTSKNIMASRCGLD
jgi:hypothetical protein